jgi:hypothetical protein
MQSVVQIHFLFPTGTFSRDVDGTWAATAMALKANAAVTLVGD